MIILNKALIGVFLLANIVLITACETNEVSADTSGNEVVLFPYAINPDLFTQQTLIEGSEFASFT